MTLFLTALRATKILSLLNKTSYITRKLFSVLTHVFQKSVTKTTTKVDMNLTVRDMPHPSPALPYLSFPHPSFTFVPYFSLALFCRLTWDPLANHPPQHTHARMMIHMQERHLIVLLSENEEKLKTTKTTVIL